MARALLTETMLFMKVNSSITPLKIATCAAFKNEIKTTYAKKEVSFTHGIFDFDFIPYYLFYLVLHDVHFNAIAH